MKTVSAKKEEVTRQWYVVDAQGQTLGRLSTEIANRLRGKHKASFTPHVDTGDYVVVINADKVRVTGRKAQDKMYYHHTGFPGGIKSISFEIAVKSSSCTSTPCIFRPRFNSSVEILPLPSLSKCLKMDRRRPMDAPAPAPWHAKDN